MVVHGGAVTSEKRVKILDFGIAKHLPDGAPSPDRRSVRTRTGTLIGTPTYMSPEQCRAAAPPDEKTDVYSLGVIFYELIYGQPPFVSESAGELFALHMFAPPTPLRQRVPAVDGKLAELVHRMLDKQPAARPSMSAVCAALKAIPSTGLSDGPAAARPSGTRGSPGSGPGELATVERILPNMRTGQTSHRAEPVKKQQPRLFIVLGTAAVVVVAIFVGLLLRSPEKPVLPPPTLPDAAALPPPVIKELPPSKPVISPSGANPQAKTEKPSRKDKPPRKGHGSKNAKQVQIDLWK